MHAPWWRRDPHAVVILEGPTRTVVDDALAVAGIERRVGVVSSSFLAVPEVLAASAKVGCDARSSPRRSPRPRA